ncbi:MAG: serine/threonine-protein phosphatase [Acidobacteria bacterium]|nr:serine/threonine-protein phosphatase [Acidobacteriota bacterium]
MRSSLLPQAMESAVPRAPVVGWQGKGSLQSIDLHAVSLPARTFTGDFYFAQRGPNGLWIALGDVAGKGLSAAVVMAMVQEDLEQRLGECVATNCDPVKTLQRLHKLLLPLLPSNRFVTAVVGHLRDDGTLVIANAGHCAPLVARADGKVESIAPTGPVVGILDNPNWTSLTTILERGETLLLYSDGVVEAKSLDDEEFGLSQVVATLSSTASEGLSAREVSGRLLAGVDRHSCGAREDDLTVVVIRRPSKEIVAARAV